MMSTSEVNYRVDRIQIHLIQLKQFIDFSSTASHAGRRSGAE